MLETVHWILDDANPLFDDLTSLREAITAGGGNIHEVKPRNYYMEEFDLCGDEECAIYYGSLRMGARIKHLKPWTPGVICDYDKLRCTHYYPLLGDQLLNQNYLMVPFGDLLRQFETFSGYFGSKDLFLRPDDGRKGFTGAVVNLKELSEYAPGWATSLHSPGLVVVSAPKQIEREYRCVVIDGKVVAQSLYKVRGQHKEEAEVPVHILEYASSVITGGFAPDVAYTLDVAELPNYDLRVVEINAFSSSGFYACDHGAIVDAAHCMARRLHAEYMEVVHESNTPKG